MSDDNYKYGSKDTFKVSGEDVGLAMATEESAAVYQLLGGHYFEGVGFTKDQFKKLYGFYGFDEAVDEAIVEEARASHTKRVRKFEEEEAEDSKTRYSWAPKPGPPTPFQEEGVRAMFEGGTRRNVFRFVRRDGLRVMAFMAQYLQAGEDPVKLVGQLMLDAGYDVEWDEAWNEVEPDEDEEGAA